MRNSLVHKVQGKKPQRSGAFRDWRSRLGGGWRLDDESGIYRKARQASKPKATKVAPRLVKASEVRGTFASEAATLDLRRRLNVGQIEKY